MIKSIISTVIFTAGLFSSFGFPLPMFATTDGEHAKLTLYAPNWTEYSDVNHKYPAYEYDGAYKNGEPYGQLRYVSNPDMVAQFKKADVLAWSFMQVWNSDDAKQAKYDIPVEWNGLMHFSDLWGELPFEASWVTPPPETADFLAFCKTVGNAACSSVQMNGNTKQMELFHYTDQKGVGQLNSFGAFINSDKFGDAKRIIAIGGANTTDNGAVSDYTYRAIFANQDKFLNQFKQWMDHFKNLKGVDYDFEPPVDLATGGQFPPGEDTLRDYKKIYDLVKATREKLGPDAYISITITSNLDYLDYINRSVSGGWFKEISNYVDAVNLMTYDFHGPWGKSGDPYTSLHAPLKQPDTLHKDEFPINYGAQAVTERVLSYGMPANKLEIGFAAYGRGFSGVNAGSDSKLPGYEQPWNSSSRFDLQYTRQAGLVPYKSIPKIIQDLGYKSFDVTALNALNNEIVVGSYIYSSIAKQFVGYESPQEVREVCQFIKEKGLQGAILWSADTDLPVSNPKSLVTTFRNNC